MLRLLLSFKFLRPNPVDRRISGAKMTCAFHNTIYVMAEMIVTGPPIDDEDFDLCSK